MLSRGIPDDPERAAPGERHTILPTGHSKRLAQLGRAGAELSVDGAATAPPHDVEPLERLQGADQHGRWKAGSLGHGVQTPVHAVGEIDIGRAGRREETFVTARAPRAISVNRRIFGTQVCLGLDAAACGAATADLAHKSQPKSLRATWGVGRA